MSRIASRPIFSRPCGTGSSFQIQPRTSVPQALTYLGCFSRTSHKIVILSEAPHRFYRVIHRLGAKSKDLEGRLSYSCRWHPFNHRSPHLTDPPRFEDFAQTWGWKMIQCMKRCTHDHQVRIAGGIQFSGLGSRKAPNSIDKISNFGVLRLRAQAVYHAIKSVRRFAQDDDFVGGSRKTRQIG